LSNAVAGQTAVEDFSHSRQVANAMGRVQGW
jgi:hypothetical protein